jgi:hypothetical protein
VSRLLSLLTVFLLAALTVSAETLRGGSGALRAVPDVAIATRGVDTFQPLAPGEMRFLGPTSAPFIGNAPAADVREVSSVSYALPRVINASTAPAGGDPWTDTVVVASPRPDSSRMDAILTGAVVRIALGQP